MDGMRGFTLGESPHIFYGYIAFFIQNKVTITLFNFPS